jgi:hypothetical protein
MQPVIRTIPECEFCGDRGESTQLHDLRDLDTGETFPVCEACLEEFLGGLEHPPESEDQP